MQLTKSKYPKSELALEKYLIDNGWDITSGGYGVYSTMGDGGSLGTVSRVFEKEGYHPIIFSLASRPEEKSKTFIAVCDGFTTPPDHTKCAEFTETHRIGYDFHNYEPYIKAKKILSDFDIEIVDVHVDSVTFGLKEGRKQLRRSSSHVSRLLSKEVIKRVVESLLVIRYELKTGVRVKFSKVKSIYQTETYKKHFDAN